MSTILFPAPVFGPVHSRRLGVSLGINLLPPDGKVCSFDCIYCECGLNGDFRTRTPLPTRQEVSIALENKLVEMKEKGPVPDVITFAGNGEPTAHPDFPTIIEDTLSLRDQYFPQAKVSVLSNATFIRRPEVFKALEKVDNNILKLDTVDKDYIDFVNRPAGKFRLDKLIEDLKTFRGKVSIQTMFLKGIYHGQSVDNTTERYVLPWIRTIQEISPREVMIYTIDRETPGKGLKKASPEELDYIRDLLIKENIPVIVSY